MRLAVLIQARLTACDCCSAREKPATDALRFPTSPDGRGLFFARHASTR